MSKISKPAAPEVRSLALYANVPETRADVEHRQLAGYAAVFNSKSVDLGGFVEILKPGAFAESLRSGDDVRALVDHDYAKILGRTQSGTLRLREDTTGLADEVDLPQTTYALDLLASVGRGDISGQSFGFKVLDDDWAYAADGTLVRTVLRMKLFEVTFTSIPAYPGTSAGVRSDLRVPDEVRAVAGRCRPYPLRDRAARLMRLAAAS